MMLNNVKNRLRLIAHKTGIPLRIRALRVQSMRLIRSCRSNFNNSHEQRGGSVPYCLYEMSADGLPTYFGYYDKTPFSCDNSKILAMAITNKKDWSKEAAGVPLRLGFFEWPEVVAGRPTFRQFGDTATWSWQQGCMLQWFPKDPDRLVLYNRLVDGKYGSVIQDVFNKDILMSYSMPIYAIDPSGRWGVSLNFSRLERLRPGYGYSKFPDQTVADACPNTDGIRRIDLETGSCQMLLSLREIADFRQLPSMEAAPHYVNVPLFSPDGNRVIFLHLWLPNGRRRSRLMLYDFTDSSFHVLDDAATVSHFAWLSEDKILCFRFPMQGSAAYYLYKLSREKSPECIPFETMSSLTDGHPSFCPSGDWVVTDTYPDKMGEQHLYICSVQKDVILEVGRFYSPPRYRGYIRCDLHPRWDRLGKRICFDSAHQGKRSIYVAEIDLPRIPN